MGACSNRTYSGVRRGKHPADGAAARAQQIAQFLGVDRFSHVVKKQNAKASAQTHS